MYSFPSHKMCHLCASVNLTLVPDYLTTVNRPIYVYSALFPDVCGLCAHEHTPKSDAEAVSVGSLCTPHTLVSDLVDFFHLSFLWTHNQQQQHIVANMVYCQFKITNSTSHK